MNSDLALDGVRVFRLSAVEMVLLTNTRRLVHLKRESNTLIRFLLMICDYLSRRRPSETSGYEWECRSTTAVFPI